MFRGSVGDGVRFVARVVAERINKGEYTITDGEFSGKKFLVASFIDKDTSLIPVAVVTEDYKSPKVLFELLRLTVAKFKGTTWYNKNKSSLGDLTADTIVGEASADFAGLVRTFQTPEKIDKFARIMKEIEETTEVMMRNLQQVLRRGEKLEDILAKTTEISESAKGFARRSEKLNDRCCTIS